MGMVFDPEQWILKFLNESFVLSTSGGKATSVWNHQIKGGKEQIKYAVIGNDLGSCVVKPAEVSNKTNTCWLPGLVLKPPRQCQWELLLWKQWPENETSWRSAVLFWRTAVKSSKKADKLSETLAQLNIDLRHRTKKEANKARKLLRPTRLKAERTQSSTENILEMLNLFDKHPGDYLGQDKNKLGKWWRKWRNKA